MNNPKYRCWHKIEKRFVDLRYIDFENETIGYDSQGEFNRYEKERFENVVFQQFTGLKDESGKKIYEGDILYASYHQLKSEVVYDKRYCFFKLAASNSLSFYVDRSSFFEIMGNIFENKELSKQS
jgi:uncharacterized phage protein (TIGR01671 family)